MGVSLKKKKKKKKHLGAKEGGIWTLAKCFNKYLSIYDKGIVVMVLKKKRALSLEIHSEAFTDEIIHIWNWL